MGTNREHNRSGAPTAGGGKLPLFLACYNRFIEKSVPFLVVFSREHYITLWKFLAGYVHICSCLRLTYLLMDDTRFSQKNSPDWIKIFLWTAFLISAGVTAVLAFRGEKPESELAATVERVPSTAQASASQEILPTLEEDKVFQARSNRPDNVPLDLEEPVVVLLTGVDKREWEEQQGPGLTDVIVVAVLDTQKHTAGLLSIPRDTWVEVPGFGYRKINQVYPLGEGYGYRGGGPKLLMETMEAFLETDIPYYVRVDFQAFVTLVDAVEGVKVEVKEPLIVDPDPSSKGLMKRLEPGVQVLPGDLALGYIRTRSTGEGDFGRTERQQQVLVSLQRRIRNFDILPRLIRKAPFLYRDLSSHVETNLTLGQITKLAWALKEVDPGNVHHKVIAPPLVKAQFNNLGQYILVPDLEEVRVAWDTIYRQTPKVVQSPTDEPSEGERIAMEAATVTVLNGTTREGLAGDTAAFFSSQGLTVGRVDNADKFTSTTIVYDYTGNPATVQRILNLMDLSESHLYHRAGSGETEDVAVILGSDWARENTLP